MIGPDDYKFLQTLLLQQSGLSLGPNKEYLIESRLTPVAATLGYGPLAVLIAQLRKGAQPAVVKSVCDAMTTNETLFFRDTTPFKHFREVLLPEAATRARQLGRAVRIWSAASSTGQEAYSLSMIVEQEEKQLGGVRVEILGTDYSTGTVDRAREGVFNQFEVQRGLPIQLLLLYFTKTEAGFRINDSVRKRVRFQEGNLLKPFADMGTFDIIFVRNVLIYFDQATKKDVLERMARQITPGGSLVLGGTENTIGVTETLARDPRAVAPVYRRASDAVRAAA